jgi:hypothetical protein
VAGESVVLEPHVGIGVPIVPRYIRRSTEMRGEPRITDALTKCPWTSLVR